MMGYVLAGLSIVIVLLGAAVKIIWDENGKLNAEKARIEIELSLSKADLQQSTENANRMLSEKNRQLDAIRKAAEEDQAAAVESAKIQKDIEYATDGTSCVDSDPVQRLLRGLRNAQNHGGSLPVDHIPDAGRPGKATGLPATPGGVGR
ncbi:hypothetical protein ACCT18_29385 [Rhizobium ruizarguesonis]